MEDEIKKSLEDGYMDIDFEDDEDSNKSKSEDFVEEAIFVDMTPVKEKSLETSEEKKSQVFNKDNKLLSEKIIEKKSGNYTEIKYGILGQVVSVKEYTKKKKIKKSTEYFENGQIDLVTDYGPMGSYRSMKYGIDGASISYVEKHTDGTSDAYYYDVDKNGSTLHVKMNRQKEVIEKKIER